MKRIIEIYAVIGVFTAYMTAPFMAIICAPHVDRQTCASRAMLVGIGAGIVWPFTAYAFLTTRNKLPPVQRPAALEDEEEPKWEMEISTPSMRLRGACLQKVGSRG